MLKGGTEYAATCFQVALTSAAAPQIIPPADERDKEHCAQWASILQVTL